MASSGNFCTWNPLGAHGGGTTDFGTLSGGNLLCTLGDTVFGNFGVTSGKWYWEWCMTGSAWDGGPGWANQQVNTQAELGQLRDMMYPGQYEVDVESDPMTQEKNRILDRIADLKK